MSGHILKLFLLLRYFVISYSSLYIFCPCVSGEWAAAVRWPPTRLGRPPTRKRKRNLCREATKRSVWRWTGAIVWKGEQGNLHNNIIFPQVFMCFTHLCLQFGKIYEVRMMMDFNGNNRGYAFVTFSTKQEAKAAMKQLNNYEIRSGLGLGFYS